MLESSPVYMSNSSSSNKDRHGLFTYYGRRPSKRKGYKRSMTVGNETIQPTALSPKFIRQSSVNNMDSLAVNHTKHNCDPHLSHEMYHRRKKNKRISRRFMSNDIMKPTPIREEYSQLVEPLSTQAAKVRFHVGNIRSNTMPEESSAELESMSVGPRCNSVPQSPQSDTMNAGLFSRGTLPTPNKTLRFSDSQHLTLAHEGIPRLNRRSETVTEGCELTTQPSTHIRPSYLPHLPLTLTPIITPSRTDYTSITDDIDTSSVRFEGSPGSPVTPRHIYFGLDVNVDLYTKKESTRTGRGGSLRRRATRADHLKYAEEAEHEQMELTIRKRIRQISLTESDSLSNIARQAIDKLETSGESNSDDGLAGYFSDEQEWSSQGTMASDLHLLSKGNSEPTLDKLGHTMDSYTSNDQKHLNTSSNLRTLPTYSDDRKSSSDD